MKVYKWGKVDSWILNSKSVFTLTRFSYKDCVLQKLDGWSRLNLYTTEVIFSW